MDDRKKIPSVDTLVTKAQKHPGARGLPRTVLVKKAREILARHRSASLEIVPDLESLSAELVRLIGDFEFANTRPIINATGIILHTNLGRAPLSTAAIANIAQTAPSYCNLEFDLTVAQRGKRAQRLHEDLAILCQAEGALVVNNCAAALLLILHSLAEGGEVVISRSELVQIGGEFRIPDILKAGGANLHEVGTTNITRLADYKDGINERTRMLLKVHQSNFVVSGHTESVSLQTLRSLADTHGIPLVMDLGSGYLTTSAERDLPELSVQDALHCGADLVCFSGDKLMGGPQAGIIVGKRHLLERLEKTPMLRALRPGRLTILALEPTIQAYLAKNVASIPVWQMLKLPLTELKARTDALQNQLGSFGINSQVTEATGAVGGGSLPEYALPTMLLEIPCADADALASKLRAAPTPVVTRMHNRTLAIDLRTVRPQEEASLTESLIAALGVR